MDIVKSIEHEQLKNKIPDLKVGNTVKVHARIKEGNYIKASYIYSRAGKKDNVTTKTKNPSI